MEFGVIPNWSWPRDGDPTEQARLTVEQGQTAIEAGYDTVWFSQHYVSEGFNQFQPLQMLSRLSADAGNTNLGTSVFLLPLHEPVAVAEQVATLSHLFDGRLEFGVSLGYKDDEFTALDVDKSDRVGRLVDGVRILRRLWSEDDVTYDGKYHSIENVTVDPKPDDVRIHIGGNAPRSVERSGKLGDGWIISGRTSPEEAADLHEHYRRGVAETDRPEWVSLNRETFVAETTEEAEEVARAGMRSRVEKWLERGASDTADAVGEDGIESKVDEMLRQRFVGSPEEVIERIEAFEAAAGVDHVICLYNWRTIDHGDVCDSMRLFAEEVAPHFQD